MKTVHPPAFQLEIHNEKGFIYWKRSIDRSSAFDLFQQIDRIYASETPQPCFTINLMQIYPDKRKILTLYIYEKALVFLVNSLDQRMNKHLPFQS